MRFKNVVFMGDGFRTHSRLRLGKPHEPAERFAKLLRPILRSINCNTKIFTRFRSGQIAELYEHIFGAEESAHTWAHRSQVSSNRLNVFYDQILGGADLVIGFEMPETAYRYCSENAIVAIDTGFHFVRFGTDYVLKVRSNDLEMQKALRAIRGDVSASEIFMKQNNNLEMMEFFDGDGDISVFVMQTRFDRSKFDGAGFVDDVRMVEGLDESFDFYKPHPHEPRPELELALRRLGAKPFPAGYNAYSFLLDHGHRARLTGVSSGLVAEADIAGAREARYLRGFPWRIEGYERYSASDWCLADSFVTVDKRFFNPTFWEYVVHGQTVKPRHIQSPTLSLKDYWNVKWS